MDPVAPPPASAPRVSLVLPVHNGQRYLDSAIASVLAQTMADFELICVDDGSSDDSPRLLAAWAARDARVRIVTQSPNRGLPAALNAGFAVARGSLHGWTSDDNLCRPHMLARLVGVLDADPAADVVHADFSLIDADGQVTGYNRVDGPDTLLLANNIGACFLYRAAVTEALGGYDEDLFGVEDYDFWLRAARRFRFVALHEDLYLYRKHDGSLSETRARRIMDLNRRIVLRELGEGGSAPGSALARTPAMRARVLRELVARDPFHLNAGLWLRAVCAAPAATLLALPGDARRLLSGWRHRLRHS